MASPQIAAVPIAAENAASDAPTVVMKFGGTSVADPERIARVARRLVAARESGVHVVGVISAMGTTTDELLRLAHEVSPEPEPRELDMLLSAGERIACALVAMAVRELGPEAISLTGSQAGIITDTVHGKARIVEIRPRRLRQALAGGAIVLVAGFQGMSLEAGDITTLGRGGTDTTAVALAAALGACSCEIYADVDGVFTADPRIVPKARLLAAVTYEEMLELASSGARALQLRSVELARNHGVRVHVRSSLGDRAGTWVMDDGTELERAVISGVTHTLEEAVYRVHGVAPADLFSALADRGVNVDTIVQTSADTIVFSAPLDERATTAVMLDRLGATWSEHDELAKVSVVGAGMASHPGIAALAFRTLRDVRVEPQFISTSPIKIAFYVPEEAAELAVRALHEAFGLAAPAA